MLRLLRLNARSLHRSASTLAPPACVFSGIQPTGSAHLGNYLGAICNWVKMQEDNSPPTKQLIFSVVDWHALSSPRPPESMRQAVLDTTATLLACGLDPQKCILFAQSQVPEHTELKWIFSCLTTIGRLSSMTQYKDKARSAKEIDSPYLALLAYPVLQAADILLYRASEVPVGEDQKQHLELARDIAARFNNAYGVNFFPLPQPRFTTTVRVMSLKDGSRKMSKSDASEGSRIQLEDTADQIRTKIQRAKTDSYSGIWYDVAQRPEVSNLIQIFASVTNSTTEQVVQQYRESTTSRFKSDLADAVWARVGPISTNLQRLRTETHYVESVLKTGGQQARDIASTSMKQVREIMKMI
eukprot:TRINITY_DN17450_c0_g1_i1.p1 TRINITY_DN17450_c0_g1~~TRINITY_DN17450_c0_g1_i1.p1  ORF type:complete len:356 (+),score=63.73 TRINITY_DN17450_c0_g1_i1:74-1141(+)